MTTTVHQLHKRKNITHAFIAAVAALSAIYIFCLFSTVADTVARANALKTADEISHTISQLEFVSINLKNSISIEDARVLGFDVVENPTYITRDSIGFAGAATSRE